jgi:hypothetical protein
MPLSHSSPARYSFSLSATFSRRARFWLTYAVPGACRQRADCAIAFGAPAKSLARLQEQTISRIRWTPGARTAWRMDSSSLLRVNIAEFATRRHCAASDLSCETS